MPIRCRWTRRRLRILNRKWHLSSQKNWTAGILVLTSPILLILWRNVRMPLMQVIWSRLLNWISNGVKLRILIRPLQMARHHWMLLYPAWIRHFLLIPLQILIRKTMRLWRKMQRKPRRTAIMKRYLIFRNSWMHLQQISKQTIWRQSRIWRMIFQVQTWTKIMSAQMIRRNWMPIARRLISIQKRKIMHRLSIHWIHGRKK